jgi:hypothetical protein
MAAEKPEWEKNYDKYCEYFCSPQWLSGTVIYLVVFGALTGVYWTSGLLGAYCGVWIPTFLLHHLYIYAHARDGAPGCTFIGRCVGLVLHHLLLTSVGIATVVLSPPTPLRTLALVEVIASLLSLSGEIVALLNRKYKLCFWCGNRCSELHYCLCV